jgi:short-subunit dehydrogenase
VARVLVTDVTVPHDLERLVETTLSQWGRIDVWINNAGTTLFGRLSEGDFAAHRRVLETNLIGPMYAARLVIPVFRRQRRGVLINVGSVLSQLGQAFVPSYAISKFGLRGLSETLRSDTADDRDIHVCTVLPYAVDTPHFETGANIIGRRAHALQPVQSADDVATAIVELANRPRRQRYVPRYIPIGLAFHWLWPRLAERLLLHALVRFHLVDSERRHKGNLFAPDTLSGTVRGSRPPIVGRATFAAWIAMDLCRIGAQWWMRRQRAR